MRALLEIKRPTVSLETVKAVLDRTEDHCLGLVQDGKLRFAWNVAAPNSHRSLVRVMTASLIDFVRGTDTQPNREEDALNYVLPSVFPSVRTSTLARALNVGSTHIHNLIDCGAMKEVAAPDRRITWTRAVTLESARRFLKERRMV